MAGTSFPGEPAASTALQSSSRDFLLFALSLPSAKNTSAAFDTRMKLLLLLVLPATTLAFVAVSPPTTSTKVPPRHGFLDDFMGTSSLTVMTLSTDKLEGRDSKKDDWKEEMYKEQQEILKRRRATGETPIFAFGTSVKVDSSRKRKKRRFEIVENRIPGN